MQKASKLQLHLVFVSGNCAILILPENKISRLFSSCVLIFASCSSIVKVIFILLAFHFLFQLGDFTLKVHTELSLFFSDGNQYMRICTYSIKAKRVVVHEYHDYTMTALFSFLISMHYIFQLNDIKHISLGF